MDPLLKRPQDTSKHGTTLQMVSHAKAYSLALFALISNSCNENAALREIDLFKCKSYLHLTDLFAIAVICAVRFLL